MAGVKELRGKGKCTKIGEIVKSQMVHSPGSCGLGFRLQFSEKVLEGV